jgi:glycosyltransferase involved in cell wall biosynthesis
MLMTEASGTSRDGLIRIVCLIDSIAQHAGTENQLVEIVKRIDRGRFEIHLCCLEDSDRLRALAANCKTAVFPAANLYSMAGIQAFLRLREYLNTNRIDIMHTFMTKSNILGVLAARRSHCRAIVASRRNLGYGFTPMYVRLFRYVNQQTTRLLANSEGARRSAAEIEHVSPDKIDILYNGVDMAAYAFENADPSVPRSLGIPEGAPVIGTVANLRPVKDLPLFLRAARIVASAAPDAVFLIVGRGPLRDELARLAAELGIASRVFFTDGKGAVVDYLHRMTVACLSSSSEGFSNSILEYMAAGLPVVATDVGGNREAIEHGVTGYIIADRSPESFGAPVIELLRDATLRARMGQAGFERCRACFDIDHAVRKHERYYAGLLGR